MITEQELRDEFLSEMIRSEEPIEVPEGFLDEVMDRISLVTPGIKSRTYSPPIWFKWGVPGVILSCLLAILIGSPAKQATILDSGISYSEGIFRKVNSWFSGFKIDFTLPEPVITETAIWSLLGGIILTLSFLLLYRFLEKKERQSHP